MLALCKAVVYNCNVAKKETVRWPVIKGLRTSDGSQEEIKMHEIIEEIEKEQLKADVPQFEVGDTVRVANRIKEGEKSRIQMFEGVVMKIQNVGSRKTFTVRKMSAGVGVEKTWPLHSPAVEKVEVIRRGKVRRAKLGYLRGRVGKDAKVKEVIR